MGIHSSCLSPALLLLVSNALSARAPPTMGTNMNLTSQCFLPPTCHPRLYLLHPWGYFSSYPPSLFVHSVHVYFGHCLTLLCACVHAYYANHVTCTALGLDQPRTLLGHTSLVIFHSHHLILVLAKTNHPAGLCLPASLAQDFGSCPLIIAGGCV